MRYIGVDLHKLNFVVCFLDENDQKKILTYPLTRAGLDAFKRELRADDSLAVEASQNCYYFLRQIRGSVKKVVLVNTYRFAPIAKSKKKTDKHDAVTLARYLKMNGLPEVSVPSDQIIELRQLLQARDSLLEMATRLKNMGHASLVRNGIARSRKAFASKRSRKELLEIEELTDADRRILQASLRQVEQLEAEVEELEQEIIERGKAIKGVERLLQITGLNLLTAIALLVEIGDIEWFDTSKQLVSYSGLATSVKQSGSRDRRGKITKEGRKRLRTILIRAVLAMVNRTKTPLMDFYQRKKKEKGAGKAIVATARKLLTIIFVMLKKELDYWYIQERLYNQKLRALGRAA